MLLLCPPSLCKQTSRLDVTAWQLFNEETVGGNQQQGFACAAPMAPTKELLLLTTVAIYNL